jgi:ketosteroid isomerase-like protein
MTKLSAFVFSVALLIGCNNGQDQSTTSSKSDSTQTAVSNDHSSDIAAIMKADSAWDKASEAKSAEGWLSYYSDDAIMMPPGENVCKDKASSETSIKKMFATPGISLRFQSTKVEVSKMGDMGYAVGVYQWSSKDANGKDYHETGKYSEIWKKQSDGNWKCIVDIWNADPAKQ